MVQYSRIDVFNTMKSTALVPMFYHKDVEIWKQILKACYDGGARVLEFTARGHFAHKVFDELSRYVDKELPKMILGVGSVTDAASASNYMALGARFIVTPVLREDIAMVCNRRKVLWTPGCGSLTEIARAEELDCEIVKLFPGETYGPNFVKAIRGYQPWTNIMPTGGVSLSKENLELWFISAVTCVGIGSDLISKDILDNRDYKKLQNDVKLTLQMIHQIKNKQN